MDDRYRSLLAQLLADRKPESTHPALELPPSVVNLA
jgi:hypothetical protein